MEQRKKIKFINVLYFISIGLALSLSIKSWQIIKRNANKADHLQDRAISEPSQSSQKELTESQKEKIKEQIRKIIDESRNEELEIYNKTISAIEEKINTRTNQAKNNINNVINQTCTFKRSAQICYLIANDMATGENKLNEFLYGIIVPNIVSPLQDGASECESELARMADAFEANRTKLQTKILYASWSPEIGLEYQPHMEDSFKELLETVNSSCSQIADIAKIKTMTSIGLTIEAVFIRTTVRCFINVLGHIARRMGVTVASSITSATADGPLPIGDAISVVISVGGAAWCAYDLYKADTEMPNRVRSELSNSIDNTRTQILEIGKANASKILETEQNHISILQEKLLAEIDREF